jgi:hypothetical protein
MKTDVLKKFHPEHVELYAWAFSGRRSLKCG